jgi:hypothetical protein
MLLFALHMMNDKRDGIAACVMYWLQLGTRFYAVVIAAVI